MSDAPLDKSLLEARMPAGLTPCQNQAFTALTTERSPGRFANVFVTGGAGSGKSYLIRQFLRGIDLREYPILASTGAAAVLVGGRTFHSFFGLGILEGGPEATVERACRNRQVARRLKQMKGFIVDEVSMLAGPVLRVAEVIARRVRDSDLPWGGLRVVAVGDFAQLPPVERDPARGGGWAFIDPVWEWTQFENQILRTQVRCQDPQYMSVLAKIRIGVVDDEVTEYLNERTGPVEVEFEGTRLFPGAIRRNSSIRGDSPIFRAKSIQSRLLRPATNAPLRRCVSRHPSAPFWKLKRGRW